MKKITIFSIFLFCINTAVANDTEIKNEFPIPKKYIAHTYLSDSMAIVNKGGKQAVEETFPHYNYINGGKWYIINSKYKVVSAHTYDEIGPMLSENYLNVKRNEKWGFINSSGIEVIPPLYDDPGVFIDQYAIVKLEDKFGIIDKSGKTIIPFEYEELFLSGGALIQAKKGGVFGIIDFSENTISPFAYDEISMIDSNIIIVVKNGKTGVLNLEGDTILSIKFETVRILYDIKARGKSYLTVSNNEQYGLYDLSNTELIPVKYDDIEWVGDNFAAVKKNGRWTIYDISKKKEIGFPLYDRVTPFYNGLATVNIGGRIGIIFEGGKHGKIDTLGNIIIPIIYESMGEFSEELIPVSKNSKWGYINQKNELVIPYQFYYARPFLEEFAAVSVHEEMSPDDYATYKYRWGGLFGFINKEGKMIIPAIYKEATNFYNGSAWVKCADEACPDMAKTWGTIDTSGNQVKPFIFDSPLIENYLDEMNSYLSPLGID